MALLFFTYVYHVVFSPIQKSVNTILQLNVMMGVMMGKRCMQISKSRTFLISQN